MQKGIVEQNEDKKKHPILPSLPFLGIEIQEISLGFATGQACGELNLKLKFLDFHSINAPPITARLILKITFLQPRKYSLITASDPIPYGLTFPYLPLFRFGLLKQGTESHQP